MIFKSNSAAETEAIGEKTAKYIKPGMVIAMRGDLGAGKTAFVRGLARGMGLKVRVTSPTFAIVNEYLGETSLYHFDMYRLTSAEDLFDIGWEDYIRAGGVCVVEWSEIVAEAIPEDAASVTIRHLGETAREITTEGFAWEEGDCEC